MLREIGICPQRGEITPAPDTRLEQLLRRAEQESLEFHKAVGFDRSYSITVGGAYEPRIVVQDNPSAGDGDVVMGMGNSGFSYGTETSQIKGVNPHADADWDPERRLFRDRQDSSVVTFPDVMGYKETGVILKSRNKKFPEGSRVAANRGRRTSVVANPETLREQAGPNALIIPLPEDIGSLLGTEVAHMGPIADTAIGITDTVFLGKYHFLREQEAGREIKIGPSIKDKTVLVVGAGRVGTTLAMFAQHAGAGEVMVADAFEENLVLPKSLGMKTTKVENPLQLAEVVKDTWKINGEHGAEITYECSGQMSGLRAAIKAARKDSPIMVVSMYQNASDEELREFLKVLKGEYHHNGISLNTAQIGNKPAGLTQEMLANDTISLYRESQYREAALASKTHIMPVSKFPDFVTFLRDPSRTDLMRPHAINPDSHYIGETTFYTDTGLIPLLPKAA